MKKIWHIALNQLLRLLRNGTVIGLMVMAMVLAVFIFFFARSDGVLLNELQIRVRYSFYFFTFMVNLALMYLACTLLRREIAHRQFHMLSAAPVHRAQLWLGKYLGLLMLGVFSFIAGSLAVGGCCLIYIKSFDDQKQIDQLQKTFFRAHYVCKPQLPALEDQVNREFKKQQLAGQTAGRPAWQVRQEIVDSIRKREQMLDPGAEKTWVFNWSPSQAQGESLILKTKFFAEQKRKKINGTWILTSPNVPGDWQMEFNGFPYQFYELKIPLSEIPESEILHLTFKGRDSPYLIFPRSVGVRLLYDNGSILKNYFYLLLFSLLNMSVLIALGLALASMFSYAVAIFVTLVVYAIGLSTNFFTSVIRDLSYEQFAGADSSFFATISTWIIQLGLLVTKGIKPPEVIEMFSDGTSIPILQLLVEWAPGFLIYTLLLIVLGIFILTKKEIDKILQA